MGTRQAPPPPPPPPPARSPAPQPAATGGSSIDDVATGQRLVILAVLANIGTAILVQSVGTEWAPLGLVAFGLALTGLFRLGSGLGYSSGKQVLLVVLSLVPLVNLAMLAIVNSEATKALRAAGYKVGFLGATKQRGTR